MSSFRGVEFFVDSAEQTGGRAVVLDEIPFSNEPPAARDLGLKARTFSVECYVLGADYERERDDLIRALELPGPGELVHPSVGVRRVMITAFRVRQDRVNRIARFTIECAETRGGAPKPLVTKDPKPVALEKLAAFKVAATEQFSATRQTRSFAGVPPVEDAVVLFALVNGMDSALDALPIPTEIRAQLTRAFNADPGVSTTTLTEFLVVALDQIFTAFEDAVISVAASLPIDPLALVLSLLDLDFGVRPIGASPTALRDQANFDSLKTLVEQRVISTAAGVLLERVFETYDDAVTARDLVTAALDDQAERTRDLGVFPALAPLRSSLVDAVPGEASSLPRLQPYDVTTPTPSLVVTHRLYGSVERELEVVARNRIAHPGFVSGIIGVLTDG